MTDGALDLVERVLPLGVPVRQWVGSLPWQLRALCGYDASLCADVCRIFTGEVSRSLRRRAKKELGLSSVADAHTGAVAFIQRFDSALRLNVHVHLLCLDGVYVLRDGDSDGELVFHELPPPDAATVAEVARRTAQKLKKLLVQRGRYLDPELAAADVASDDSHDEPSALSACQAAAVGGTDLFGARAGAPALRLVDPSKARPDEPVAIAHGINVHAQVAVHGNDRARLERLCRYLVTVQPGPSTRKAPRGSGCARGKGWDGSRSRAGVLDARRGAVRAEWRAAG